MAMARVSAGMLCASARDIPTGTGCRKGVRRVSEGCQMGVRSVSEGARRVSDGCQKGVRRCQKVSEVCRMGHLDPEDGAVYTYSGWGDGQQCATVRPGLRLGPAPV